MFERGRALLAARFFLRVAAVAAVPQLAGCSVTQFFGPLGHADSQQKRHINAEGEVWFPLGRQRDAQTLLESLGLRSDIGVMASNTNPRFLGSGKKTREGRRASRRTVGADGWIKFDGGFARRACQVLDISDTGVRLSTNGPVPDVFQFVSTLGALPRRARVKWRRGNEIGAEFF